MSEDAPRPEIPPGMRLHLEAAQAEVRRAGVTQQMVDRTIESLAYGGRIDRFVTALILDAHAKDGWRDRRRLKRGLRLGTRPHLRSCSACRKRFDDIVQWLVSFNAELEKTAPE